MYIKTKIIIIPVYSKFRNTNIKMYLISKITILKVFRILNF